MMIYDLLKAYRDYLLTVYRHETVETYYKRLCTLFEGQSIINTVNSFNINKVLDKLGQIKYKNYFSQTKNALLHFCEFQNISLSSDTMESIRELEKGTKKKYRKLKAVDYNQADRKIKHIKNKKLKLSYQTIIATGLRVFELASICPRDCVITDSTITFNFIGKGGNKESVVLQATEYPILYQRLKELIENTQSDKKVFYSAIYLQTKAKELGFGCHDLRRAYAKLEYKKCGSKEKVKEKMRHSSIKNTNIYLNSKVKI